MRSLTSLFFSTAYSITIIVIASLTRQSLLVILLINLSQMFFSFDCWKDIGSVFALGGEKYLKLQRPCAVRGIRKENKEK